MLTSPYAVLLSCSSVTSATYAKMTEKVTEKAPDTEIMAKYHLKFQSKETYLGYQNLTLTYLETE